MSVIQATHTISIIATAIKEYKEYAMEREFQKTERHRITAQLRAFNKLIEVKSVMFQKMIDSHFASLNNAMEIMNTNYKIALEIGHKEIAMECLKSLTAMTNSTLNNTFIAGINALSSAFDSHSAGAINKPNEQGLLSPVFPADE